MEQIPPHFDYILIHFKSPSKQTKQREIKNRGKVDKIRISEGEKGGGGGTDLVVASEGDLLLLEHGGFEIERGDGLAGSWGGDHAGREGGAAAPDGRTTI